MLDSLLTTQPPEEPPLLQGSKPLPFQGKKESQPHGTDHPGCCCPVQRLGHPLWALKPPSSLVNSAAAGSQAGGVGGAKAAFLPSRYCGTAPQKTPEEPQEGLSLPANQTGHRGRASRSQTPPGAYRAGRTCLSTLVERSQQAMERGQKAVGLLLPALRVLESLGKAGPQGGETGIAVAGQLGRARGHCEGPPSTQPPTDPPLQPAPAFQWTEPHPPGAGPPSLAGVSLWRKTCPSVLMPNAPNPPRPLHC